MTNKIYLLEVGMAMEMPDQDIVCTKSCDIHVTCVS